MKRGLILLAILFLPLQLFAGIKLSDDDLSIIWAQSSLKSGEQEKMPLNVFMSSSRLPEEDTSNKLFKSAGNIYSEEDSAIELLASQIHVVFGESTMTEGQSSQLQPTSTNTIEEELKKLKKGYIYAYDLDNMEIQPILVKPSISYVKGETNSQNGPAVYTIKSGNIEMRDCFINQSSSKILPGGWVDVMPH